MDRSQLLAALSDQLRIQAAEQWALEDYYRGQQPLSFLAPQIQEILGQRLRQLVVNWPRLIVKSVARRCYVEGFRTVPGAPADDDLWRIWQANGMDPGSHQGHVKALVAKRAFVSVWAGRDKATPRIAVESPSQMTVAYTPGTTTVMAGYKQWRDATTAYANLYLPDSVVRYVGKAAGPVVNPLEPNRPDVPLTQIEWAEVDEIPNPLGQVPIVPLVNDPDLDCPDGVSELADVIPLADAINKLATDMMVSAEFHAMPRRWATGVELGGPEAEKRKLAEIREAWEKAYPSKFLLAEKSDVKFGQFEPVGLENFISGIKLLASQVAALAGLPPHYLGINADNPASADAIRSAEASLVERAEEKHRFWGESWEQVMRLAAHVRDGSALSGGESMETIWRDPATPTVSQKADAAVKLTTGDVPIIDVEQAQEDLGYSPVQIARMKARRAETAAEAATADVRARLALADELMVRDPQMTRPAALAAVGLLQSAALMSSGGTTPPPAGG